MQAERPALECRPATAQRLRYAAGQLRPWRRQIDRVPQFAEFRSATTREIPVVALQPVGD
ncbi:hypothetical protein [Dactylosporangium sp. NPDC051484]|uniref:hypothetical protein n=1 Tax=Dactylosporangium sp. NPDC051484 TaxID=3154942 RepID=UPI00344F7830